MNEKVLPIGETINGICDLTDFSKEDVKIFIKALRYVICNKVSEGKGITVVPGLQLLPRFLPANHMVMFNGREIYVPEHYNAKARVLKSMKYYVQNLQYNTRDWKDREVEYEDEE